MHLKSKNSFQIGLALTAIFISYLWLSREPEKSEKSGRKKVWWLKSQLYDPTFNQ